MNGGNSVRVAGQLSDGSRRVVGARMKAILRGRKMSGRHLAELIDVPSSTLNDVLNGKSEPTLGMLVRMVHFLELRSIEELIAPFGTSELRVSEYPDDGILP